MKIRSYSLLILLLLHFIYIGCSNSDSDPVAPSLAPPAAPDSLEVTTLSDSSVELEWKDNSDDEEGFQLEYSKMMNFQSYSGMDLDPDITTVTIDELDASTEYFFRIYSYNDDGDSDFSNVDSTVTSAITEYPPFSPENLTATTVSYSEILLEWTDTSENEEGFQLEYSTLGTFDYFYAVEIDAGTETTTIDELDGSTKYYFRIYAYNQFGESEYANIDSTITDITPSNEPTAPDSLTLVVVSDTRIRAEWNDTSSNEDNFLLQWSTNADFSVTYFVSVPSNTEIMTIGGLDPATHYYFRICAENSYGKSSWSSIENESTIATMSGSFSISNGAEWTNTRSVGLYMYMSGVTQMQFSNDGVSWSALENYSSIKSWTLSTIDGTKTVYARFYNSLGSFTVLNDKILLDTTFPVIESFKINNGDDDTYNSTVTLNHNVTGATKMRYSRDNINWTSWYDFSLTSSYTINTGEDVWQYVYAQYKDDHENIVSKSDVIMYDKIRTIKIMAIAIYVEKAGDGGSTGEIYWEFRGKNNETSENFDISVIDRLDYVSMPEETLHIINIDPYNTEHLYSTTVTRGESGNYISLYFRIWDNDGGSVYDDDATGAGFMNIYESQNWNIGEYYNYWFDDESQPITGYIRFIVQEVD